MSSRYERQVALIGPAAQEKLAAAHVAVLGAGGLGSPALLYLAAAGVGTITVIDDDTVDVTNLHRQVIHSTSTLGKSKAGSAKQRMTQLNPQVRVNAVAQRLTWENALDLLRGADVVLDGSDNFDARHVASHAAARLDIPHVWASILGHEAQLSVFWAGRGPVYEDLFPAPPPPGSVPSCAQAGVLGPLVGMVGSAMAMEAVKIITGLGEPLFGRLAYLDSLTMNWEFVPVLADAEVTRRVLVDAPPHGPAEVDAPAPGATVIDVRTPEEFARSHLEGAVNVPLDEILAGRTPAEAENGAVVVCARGARSAQAVAALEARGVRGLASLRGGLQRYRSDSAPG
ncbi:ThiF family adenylyltransferase [Corynebacterium mayonis]|uniref:ThiF family adenylyltransferase n=1 Tax=Corynebacterium mayonis TaxID=3062461 RepID=UPI00314068AA